MDFVTRSVNSLVFYYVYSSFPQINPHKIKFLYRKENEKKRIVGWREQRKHCILWREIEIMTMWCIFVC